MKDPENLFNVRLADGSVRAIDFCEGSQEQLGRDAYARD